MSVECESLAEGLKYFSRYTNVALGLLISLSFEGGNTGWSKAESITAVTLADVG